MVEFRCQAMIEGKVRCNEPSWNNTSYCRWHNCFLTWRGFYLMTRSLKRSAGWIPYDPTMIPDWTPPRFFSTTTVRFWIILYPFIAVIGKLSGLSIYAIHPTLLDALVAGLQASAFLAILVMCLGNSNPVIPKLLLGVAIALVLVEAYLWTQSLDPTLATKRIPTLAGGVAVLLWALPSPTGPMANADADMNDPLTLPPMNLGAGALHTIGFLLYLIFIAGTWLTSAAS